MNFALIAAADKNLGIGIHNQMPWHLKGDLKYFSETTTTAAAGKVNAVIMGRKTWESLPEKYRPLKGRLNVVLSRGEVTLPEGVLLASSLDLAFAKLGAREDVDRVFVIGGATLFAEAIQRPDCEKVYLTEIMAEYECDAFFPKIPPEFNNASMVREEMENGVKYRFMVYERS